MTVKQIGGSLSAPDGSHYVTLTDGAGNLAPASGGTTSNNLTQVGGSNIALGQTTMSASLPVTIASNQTPVATIGAEIASDTTGTFTNGTQTTSITASGLDGYGTALISINGTYGTATGVFEISDDAGTTWYGVLGNQTGASVTEGGYTSLTNTSRTWVVPVSGADSFRVRSTAVASGTVTIRISISSAVPPSSSVITGTVSATQSGTWTVQPGNTANTTAWKVDGSAVTQPVSGTFWQTTQPVSLASVPSHAVTNAGTFAVQANTEGTKATYSSAVTFSTAASATDIFNITGSGTKTIRVTRIAIVGAGTSLADVSVYLIKRSSANGAGTAMTKVPHDSTSAASTATVQNYTANPSLGSTVGSLRISFLTFAPATAQNVPLVWDFTTRNGQSVVLRGTAESVSLFLNSVTVTGGAVGIEVEWTEE